MCGIAGFIDASLVGQADRLKGLGSNMASALAHRGPDAQGVWADEAAGLVLSMRRLAIVDLSAAGAQPMVSADERWVISFNGEIYNARKIATAPELTHANWRGHSDTEVILELFARRGVTATLADMNGMFAIALWDRRERILYLIRDHLGIKPLYVLEDEGRVAFASELKAFSRLDRWSPKIDMASVTSFFRFGCIPAPFSIYKRVRKLMPGEIMTITPGKLPVSRRYWSVVGAAEAGIREPLDVTDNEAITLFDELLADAVSQQMISDVPIGAFLSGGIDSSTVTAHMVRAGRGPVRTFSIGSHDLDFDESRHAGVVARHLGTTHTELTVTAQDALDVVDSLPQIYDEPFADSSQIPTFLISKLTRQHVTVALSGDGGDEILGGYNRHVFADGFWKHFSAVPVPFRAAAAFLMQAVPDRAYLLLQNLIPARRRPAQFLEKLHKLIYIVPVESRELYLRLLSLCFEPSRLTRVAEHDAGLPVDAEQKLGSLLSAMQLGDIDAVPAGRYSAEGRPRLDGGLARSAAAAFGSPHRRVLLAASKQVQGAQRRIEMASAAGAGKIRTEGDGCAPEERLFDSRGRLVAGPATRVVGRSAGARNVRRRIAGCERGGAPAPGFSCRPPRVGKYHLGVADVRVLAPQMGLMARNKPKEIEL